MAFRDVAVRTVAAACRLVGTKAVQPDDNDTELEVRTEFEIKVVSSFSEIFNNVVKHSYAESDGLIDIHIELAPNGLNLYLIDEGEPFELDESPTLPPAPHESGRGLFIVRSFVDDLTYTPGPPNRWRLEISGASADSTSS